MKIFINATTLLKGGALQAASSFIAEAVRNREQNVSWHFALSSVLIEELRRLGVAPPRGNVTVFDVSPARDKAARHALRALERNLRPSVVYSIFGPAYVLFDAPHLCGVAVPWVTHPNCLAFGSLVSGIEKAKMLSLIFYKSYWFRKADAWLVEAEIAKRGLERYHRLNPERIQVVPNSCAEHYLTASSQARFPVAGQVCRILSLSAYYPHKNLESVPKVARELRNLWPDGKFEFVLTLPDNTPECQSILDRATSLDVREHVTNVGQVPLAEGPDLYANCHVCFLPSLLETFSANGPEAMACGVPIVSADLGFSRDVCGDAALYFAPRDPRAAAEIILDVLQQRNAWESLARKGKEVLRKFPGPVKKYEQHLAAIEMTAALS